MKLFEQISGEESNKNKLIVFNCFLVIIFFILFDELKWNILLLSVFKVKK